MGIIARYTYPRRGVKNFYLKGENKMKKNVMMRLACFLLVAVLISTSAISGTYAKYTTQDAGNDEARVAKWGVELQVFGNLYGDTYIDSIYRAADATDKSMTVQTLDTSKDVVAPGTKNEEGFEISLKGQPEVDGTITTSITTQNIFLAGGSYGVMVAVNGTTITAANFEEFKEVADGELYKKVGTNFEPATVYETGVEYYTLEDKVTFYGTYYPVVYTADGSITTSSNYTEDSLAKIANEIITELGLPALATAGNHIYTTTGTTKFNSNDDLAGYKLNDLAITWEWQYDWDGCNKAGDKAGDKAGKYCKADTILGNLQDGTLNVVKLNEVDNTTYEPVADEFYCLNTQFAIDITVTQDN